MESEEQTRANVENVQQHPAEKWEIRGERSTWEEIMGKGEDIWNAAARTVQRKRRD